LRVYDYNLQIKKSYRSLFRKCTAKDFEDKGYNIESYGIEFDELERRLCPNSEELSQLLMLKENNVDLDKRSYFNIEVSTCVDYYSSCKTNTKIKNLLKEVKLSLHISEESVNL